MATARPDKEQMVESLERELADKPTAFLVDFVGLDVAGATDLRRRLREEGAGFKVVKNTLALRALGESPIGQLESAFTGQTAIAYTREDVVGLAKVLNEFVEEHETPKFKAGVVDGQPITPEQFDELAKLPSREELVAKALYLMQYPIQGLVTVLSGVLRNVVVVLDQVRRLKEESGDEAAAVAAAPAEEAEVEAAPPESVAAEEAEAAAEPAAVGSAAAAEAETPAEAEPSQDVVQEAEAAAEPEADRAAAESPAAEEAEVPVEAEAGPAETVEADVEGEEEEEKSGE